MPTFEELATWVRRSEIGAATLIASPFGARRMYYADLTASARALSFIEARVARVLPLYANVHSASSTAGRATAALREDARRAVARGVGAGPEDVVLFVGSGATAAVNKLVGLLGLRIPEPLEREYGLSRAIPPERRPVVLAGPYEHHSNELPWLESIAEVVEIELRRDGAIDLADLRRKAAAFHDRPLRIGAFSAASNVTGVLTDVPAVCRILHAEGALACVDYAAAGPYVPIDMHPADPAEQIDAVFLSTHKFMGGPGASGVLVASASLFRSCVPERPGGGTVDYVGPAYAPTPGDAGREAPPARDRGLRVDYAPRLAEREEGGTPNILGDVRAGLAFELRALLDPHRILAHEVRLAEQALARLSAASGTAAADLVLQCGGAAPRARLRAARPPLRRPGAGRLRLRWPVRPPVARDRSRPLRALPAPHPRRAARREAGLGAHLDPVLRLARGRLVPAHRRRVRGGSRG